MDKVELGKRIREARNSKGFTQEKLAEILATADGILVRIPSREVIERLR